MVKLLQLQMALPDGTIVHVDFDNHGAIRGIHGIFNPLTDAQRAQAVMALEAIRRALARLDGQRGA